jgi:hypothetical protein
MISASEAEERYASLDAALESWRQGDYAIGPFGFVKRFDPGFPLKEEERGQDYDSDVYEEEVEGFVVLTQTCDLVRSSKDRPYLEVSPLVAITDHDYLNDIRKGRRPRYAYIPGAADALLVADLDRVMTIEKTVLGRWSRREGCTNDANRRLLAEALARKRARFAFPDDFETIASTMRNRIRQKHDKDSTEGERLRVLREIRVTARPSWTTAEVKLKFWFVVDEEATINSDLCRSCETWMSQLAPQGRFITIEYDLVSLDGMSAREYTESDRIDFDHLSRTP